MRIVKKIKKALTFYFCKDKHQRAVSRWFSARGDSTLRVNYDLNEQSIVFDLGGYHGDFAYEMHRRYGCTVYVFEPVERFYTHIKKRFEGIDTIKVFNFGLSNSDTEVSISLDNDASSVYIGDACEVAETIELRDIEGFLTVEGITHIDLLKSNIEGGEFDVLPRLLEMNRMPQVDNIQVQFHLFVPQAILRRKEIQRALQKTHKLTYNFYFVWENWKRI
jgi:FkbM family methyltransferase